MIDGKNTCDLTLAVDVNILVGDEHISWKPVSLVYSIT